MLKSNEIYLDYAAGAEANSSSIHSAGMKVKIKLQNSRREVASVLGARPEEIIFTSGGTESNNLAIQGIVFAWYEKKKGKILPHIITTNIEHPSVLETCRLLHKRKLAEISIISVEENGIVDPQKIKKEIKKNTILISVMYANNEIGTIQPIKEIAKQIKYYKKKNKRNDIFFHTDAVQAVNYFDLNVERLGVDLLSLSGSKIEGSGRVGVLFKKKSVPLVSIFGGGDQEHGFRPGTENLPEIFKFTSALVTTQQIREKEIKRLTKLRDYFISSLIRANKRIVFNGDLQNRLPNNVNITISKIPSDLLVIELSAKGIMASSKSACKSSKAEGSYVIKALHREADPEIGGLRFSLGRDTTKKDIDYTVKTLANILIKLKKWYH
ncbi:MAG: cysteine desulfurase family protein [Candidatus Paceibacterota bacterium]